MSEDEVGYRKPYRMRIVIKGRKHITVAIPYEVIERQATIKGMTVVEFIDKYVAVAEFNNFEGIRYTFKEVGV